VPKQALARRFAQRLVSPVRPHLNRAANIALARRLLGAPVPAPSRSKRCDIDCGGIAHSAGRMSRTPARRSRTQKASRTRFDAVASGCPALRRTHRWREVDSNHRSRPAIATELRYVRARCVATANGCQFHTAPVKWPNQLQLRLASNQEKLGGKAMTEKTVRPHSVLRRTMLVGTAGVLGGVALRTTPVRSQTGAAPAVAVPGRWGLHPLEKRRLVTAHVVSGRSRSMRIGGVTPCRARPYPAGRRRKRRNNRLR
jgi:hypothetical protein